MKKLFLLPLLIFLVLIFACEDKTPAVETNTYTVFFYHNNELIKVGEYTEGETVIFPEIMNNPGFVFKGFFLNDKLLNENFLMPNTDIVINKIFIPIVYTITFNIETVPSQYINHGELIEIPIEPTKEKYIFLYWSFNGYEFDFNTPVTNDIMLIAVFEPIIYTISFNIDSVPNQYLTYSDNITMPDNPVKEHHVFLYWSFNGYEFDFNTPVTSDIVLIAVFEPVIFTISFNIDSVPNQYLTYLDAIVVPDNPTKENYIFLHWTFNGYEFDFNTPVTSDIMLIAKWVFGFVHLFFDTGGGTYVPSVEISRGGVVPRWKPNVFPPVSLIPSKNEHIFVGWSVDGNIIDFVTPIYQDTELKAVWKINRFFSLQQAYNNNWIYQHDLLNMAYILNNGNVFLNDERIDFSPELLEPINLEIANKIKSEFIININSFGMGMGITIDDVIMRNFGTYNGMIAVILTFRGSFYLTATHYEEIGGVLFRYPTIGPFIRIWNSLL